MRFGVDDEGWIEVRADLPRDGLSAEEVVEALWWVGPPTAGSSSGRGRTCSEPQTRTRSMRGS